MKGMKGMKGIKKKDENILVIAILEQRSPFVACISGGPH